MPRAAAPCRPYSPRTCRDDPEVRRRRGRRRHRRPRHRARRRPDRALGRRRRARAAARDAPDRPQLQRHPLRALLRAGRAEGAARRRGLRGDRRVLPRARPAARGVRQARRRDRARRAAADGGARSGAATPTASRATSSTRRACARTSRTCAGSPALFVPSTGICDYRAVAEKLGELVVKEGGEIHLGRSVRQVVRRRADVVVRGDGPATCSARQVVAAPACTATSWPRASGADPGVRIVPFRGEYAGFSDRAAALVRGLIYPVPDPAFPFLGVHATRGIDGHVHAGPNAVLALAREGYGWGTVNPRELLGRRSPTRACCGSPEAALALRVRRDAPVAVAGGDGPPDPADAARRPAPTTCTRRVPACGPRRSARRHAGRRLPVRRAGSRARARCCTCSTRPRPPPPPPCRSAGRSSSASPARSWGRL